MEPVGGRAAARWRGSRPLEMESIVRASPMLPVPISLSDVLVGDEGAAAAVAPAVADPRQEERASPDPLGVCGGW
jgi:hypothetical protein